MKDELLKPIADLARPRINVIGAAEQFTAPTAGPSEAAVSDLKPDLSSDAEAKALVNSITKKLGESKAQGLDAIKGLDLARIDKLLSED